MKQGTPNTRFWLLAGVAACVMSLPACQPKSSSQPHAWSYKTASNTTIKAEDLLDSEGGPYDMVEEEDDSPTHLHDLAKKAQNPKNMRGMVHEGIDYELAAQKEDTYTRTVRLVRNGEEIPEQVEVAGLMPAKTDLIIDSGMEEVSAPPTPMRKPEAIQTLAEIGVPLPEEKPQIETRVAMVDVPTPSQKPQFEYAQELNAEDIAAHEVAAIAPAAGGDMVEISALRFGTHPDKVRMVFDVSGPASFEHKLDNSDHTLSIEIPDAEWHAGQESEILKSPLVEGYRTSHEGHGTKIDLTLKKPVKVLWAAALKPEGGKGNRLVLDLSAL